MTVADAPPRAPLPSARSLAASTVGAFAVAAIVLLAAILPAEYGVDPTGVGRALGLARLSDPPADGVDVAATPRDALNRTVYRLAAEWTLTQSTIGVWNGTIGELKTERVRFPLDFANVTSVTALLEWRDDNATRPDEVEVSLEGAGRASQLARAVSGPDGRGNAAATVQTRSVPFPRANGTDPLVIPAGDEDRGAVGEWTATVRGYEIGDHPDGTEDPGAEWRLTVTVEHYALRRDVDANGRGGFDRVAITLQPDDDVEYKLHMLPGARLEYRWQSTLPVYSDFHGDTETNPDEFVQYRVQTAVEDRGELTAEFDGRHGWYFKNDEPRPLTVVLETRGEYRILGVI